MRVFAAAEANSLGYGGVSLLSISTGLARSTIRRGQLELASTARLAAERIRRAGRGRKKAAASDPVLSADLEQLVEPLARGDPMSPLRWTCKSVRTLTTALQRKGHDASPWLVWSLLHEMKYSLQANRKMEEGDQHPDRNAQLEHINRRVTAALKAGQPVISVDTKKKELVGNYKNGGRQWHRKKDAPRVQGHDFHDPKVPRAYPYGIYDLAQNRGHVVVGTDHDTR